MDSVGTRSSCLFRRALGAAVVRTWAPRAGLTLLLLAAPLAPAEEGPGGDPAAAAPEASEARQALDALFESIRARLGTGTDRSAALRAALPELLAFAEKHPDTDEGAIALLNHGHLARLTGDKVTAEKSLRQALAQARNARLKAEVQLDLAKVTVQPGRPLPEFQARTIKGEAVSSTDYQGKVLLLDFWASWCVPCQIEMPNVKQLYARHHPVGLEILGVSLDYEEKDLHAFLKETPLSWSQVFNDSQGEENNLALRFGAESIPHTVLVGRDGKIRAVGLRGEELAEAVRKALGEKEGS